MSRATSSMTLARRIAMKDCAGSNAQANQHSSCQSKSGSTMFRHPCHLLSAMMVTLATNGQTNHRGGWATRSQRGRSHKNEPLPRGASRPGPRGGCPDVARLTSWMHPSTPINIGLMIISWYLDGYMLLKLLRIINFTSLTSGLLEKLVSKWINHW